MAALQTEKTLMTRIRDLPLRHRLILPFLLLAFFGTFALVWVAILSQDKIISQQEEQRLHDYYHAFSETIDLHGRWALSLAATFARNPQIADALAQQDRLRLLHLCYPAYLFMKEHFGVRQFLFEVPPGRAFLRLHRLSRFGDPLWSRRPQVRDVFSHDRPVYGLEKGLTGYGIRALAPVHRQGRIVGAVEIGFDFGLHLLRELKKRADLEITLLSRDPAHPQHLAPLASTIATRKRKGINDLKVLEDGKARLSQQRIGTVPYVILTGPITDYRGQVIGLVELGVDRSDTLRVISHYRRWMLGLGVIGMLLSVWAIYVVSYLFTRPIARMVSLAKAIAQGQKVQRIVDRPSGELGVLADAINEMLTSLEESRQKIREYADTLEKRVEVRTRALRESEEKYRTLVENVPLVVYRLLENGKVIFINSFIEELIGVSAAEAMADETFWKTKVYEEDRDRIWPLMDRCLTRGEEFKAEYRVRHQNGKFVYVFDHALPVLDEQGQVESVDGMLVNVTDRHRLQQQIIQTEELRTLSQISARLAHEIRNPLAAAGGFARRLLQNMAPDDENRPKAEIILQEVARLEKLLEKSLAYLRPFELAPARYDINELVRDVIEHCRESLGKHNVECEIALAKRLEAIRLDRHLFKKALETLIRGLASYCRLDSCRMTIRTIPGENVINLEIEVSGIRVSDDDLEHFFYPFAMRVDDEGTLELPIAKMIIHKHKGIVEIYRKSADQLVLAISLPVG